MYVHPYSSYFPGMVKIQPWQMTIMVQSGLCREMNESRMKRRDSAVDSRASQTQSQQPNRAFGISR